MWTELYHIRLSYEFWSTFWNSLYKIASLFSDGWNTLVQSRPWYILMVGYSKTVGSTDDSAPSNNLREDSLVTHRYQGKILNGEFIF